MAEEYTVILVPSTSYAIQVEKVLGQAGIPCKMIPVPRQLSSDCGVCVRIHRENAHKAVDLIQHADIDMEGLYNI